MKNGKEGFSTLKEHEWPVEEGRIEKKMNAQKCLDPNQLTLQQQ